MHASRRRALEAGLGATADGSRSHAPVGDIGLGFCLMYKRTINEDTDGLAEARARLAESLRVSGRAGPTVSEAFLAVPRHVFLPRDLVAHAYEDTAIVTKSDADGLPVSSSTQPA